MKREYGCSVSLYTPWVTYTSRLSSCKISMLFTVEALRLHFWVALMLLIIYYQ